MFDLRSERYHGCAYKSDLWESEWSNGGDYAARWFAALVDMCGVPSNGVSAREAFRRFEAGDREAAKRAIGAGTFLPPPQIEMMGLFDTVKATLFDSDFDLAKRPGIVKKVCHAMSYHEKRSLFPVSRFDPDPGHVEEVWFTGSHTDVGGGYVVRGLADMTLAWMIENARECGLSFADGPIPDDTAVHEVRYNDSSSFFWSVAGLFTKGAVHAERESEVGDVFHWQVHGLRDMFVDVEPALSPEDMIVYSRPMNPGVMMA